MLSGMRRFAFLAFTFVTTFGLGQNPQPYIAPRGSVFELLYTRYRFESDGTGRREVIARIHILNDLGVRQRSEETFEYRFLSDELEIEYFRVRKKDGSIVRIDTGAIERPQDLPEGTPRFDYNEKRVRIPGLAPGDVIEYDVAIIIHHPLGPGEFYVGHNFASSDVADEQVEVDLPRDRPVKVKAVSDVKAWLTGDSKREVYHWRNLNLEIKPRSYGNPWSRTPDIEVSSFSSWEDVGRWYAALQKGPRAVSPELKAKADELTEGLKGDSERVEALYNFAAKKVKYVSLASLGIGGYEPHLATETLHSQYGDCKDKVALLAALLEAEGFTLRRC
jgi:transglutaminase-like putative cysteine protease